MLRLLTERGRSFDIEEEIMQRSKQLEERRLREAREGGGKRLTWASDFSHFSSELFLSSTLLLMLRKQGRDQQVSRSLPGTSRSI